MLGVKTWVSLAKVMAAELATVCNRAGEEAAAKRTIGGEADAQLGACIQEFILGIARPQGVFCLQCCYSVGSVRAPQCCGRCFADAEEPDLTLGDEAPHGADGVFNRHCGVDAVDIIEIDEISGETAKARLARLTNVFWT